MQHIEAGHGAHLLQRLVCARHDAPQHRLHHLLGGTVNAPLSALSPYQTARTPGNGAALEVSLGCATLPVSSGARKSNHTRTRTDRHRGPRTGDRGCPATPPWLFSSCCRDCSNLDIFDTRLSFLAASWQAPTQQAPRPQQHRRGSTPGSLRRTASVGHG